MNEKFGFLSNFRGMPQVNVKKNTRIVTPPHGELTDNPPIRDNQAVLTDDDSDQEDENQAPTSDQRPPSLQIVNRILMTSSSSNLRDQDKTFCSELEKSPQSSLRKSSSEPSSILMDSRNSRTHAKPLVDTVVASPTVSDDLCSQLSELNVQTSEKAQPLADNFTDESDEEIVIAHSRQSRKFVKQMADTVVGTFTDESFHQQQPVSRVNEFNARGPKKPVEQMADTVVGTFTDESDNESPVSNEKQASKTPLRHVKRRPMPRPSLPATVVGFSDSMTEPSILAQLPAPIEEEIEDDGSWNEDEVIEVLDSSEEDVSELKDNNQPPLHHSSFVNCSSIVAKSNSGGKESDSTLNRFFNNPPLISHPEHVVTHLTVLKQHNEQLPETVHDKPTFQTDKDAEEDESSDLPDDLDLPPTDLSETDKHDSNVQEDKNQNQEESSDEKESNEIVPSQKTQIASESSEEITQSTSEQTVIGQINFTAKININLKMKISTRNSSDTSESSGETSSSSSDSPPQKEKSRTPAKSSRLETPKKSVTKPKHGSFRNDKQAAGSGSANKNSPAIVEATQSPIARSQGIEQTKEDFCTPTKAEEVVIDDDMQKILNSLYGDSWKTPQLLRSCKSKAVQRDLRKSIHTNNFENFVKNLPKDLESTRITASSSDESVKAVETKSSAKKKEFLTSPQSVEKKKTIKKPVSSVKKTSGSTPESDQDKIPKRGVKTTPRYLDICDSDSSSDDSSSDGDFNPNDTWNASSDDEEAVEEDRIKKRSIARKSRKDEEFVFIPDSARTKKLEDALERFEFKKPPSMIGTETPKKIAKRKLFNHSHYDDDFIEPPTEEKAIVDKIPEIIIPRPNLINKKVQDVKDSAKKIELPQPSPVIKKILKTPKSCSKNEKVLISFGPYSFLKSLDVETNPSLCNPEALLYRKNYKTKKVELTEKLFKLYNENVFDGKLSEVPTKWNKKLLNTAGRCNNSRRSGVRQSQIDLSDKVLTSADRLRCTLIHEMCHAATWIINGENGHGARWKSWAAKANQTFPELPKINVCHDYTIEYRYTYQCISCKAKYQAHSKSKKVENIRCSICRGSIELFLNKKNKEGEVVMTPVSKNVKGFPKFVKLKYKEVKRPNMTHKEVMQVLSSQFACLSVEEKQNL